MEEKRKQNEVKDLGDDNHRAMCKDAMEEIANEAEKKFNAIVAKYNMSREDGKSIFLAANQMEL